MKWKAQGADLKQCDAKMHLNKISMINLDKSNCLDNC